jgi:hypothetical protein
VNEIRLELAPNGRGTRVFIDGVEQRNVCRVMLDVTPDAPPRITIGYFGGHQVIVGKAEVAMVNTRPEVAPTLSNRDSDEATR